MKNLFTILALLVCFNFSAHSQKIDSLFLEASIQKLKGSEDYTLKMANLMPDDKYSFRATPVEMTFGEQLLHISSNIGWLCTTYLDGAENPVTKMDTKLTKKKDILMVVHKAYDYALTILQHFDATHLADTVSFFAGPMNQLQIINLLSDHQTHHQGQLIVYLRLNGIKPPDYVGW
ncbi:MAG: DinB family protein [Ginsengibacter sp.]